MGEYNKLTLLHRLHNVKKQHPRYLCICDCGNLYIGDIYDIKNGHTTSCGCARKGINKTHGFRYTRQYEVWCGIKKRCYNSKSKSYKNYGGRGITMCDEWKNDFKAFYDWSIENGYKDNLSIDRIDVNGNYEPSNCRWVDRLTQANNKRDTRWVTFNSKTQSLSDWCRELNLNYRRCLYRLNHNYEVKEVFNPCKKK